jgi:hypothetical protein
MPVQIPHFLQKCKNEKTGLADFPRIKSGCRSLEFEDGGDMPKNRVKIDST